MAFKIFSGAIFLGDSHANFGRENFSKFLQDLAKSEKLPPQIFFLGDMFDFLANTHFSQKFYAREISLINEISKRSEIFYFEGNHDFNLAKIFKNVKVFENSVQPVKFISENGEKIEISHGDIFLPPFTQKSLLFLRNKIFLFFMNCLDFLLFFKISKAILKSQTKKILYKKAENFRNFIEPKIHNYTAEIIIEGHYHQDEILNFKDKIYINLNSFAVEPKFYEAVSENGKFALLGRNFSQNLV